MANITNEQLNNAILGFSSGNFTPAPAPGQQTQTGGTSAPSPNRTDAEVLAAKIEGRKAIDAYTKQHEATSGRMRDSGTRRAFYDKTLAEDYALTEKIKNSDIRDIMAGINGYERAASNYAKAISAREIAEIRKITANILSKANAFFTRVI